MPDLEYGCLAYDVPVTQRSTYNKLRKRLRGKFTPMTWSVGLIPWGMRNEITAILEEIEQQKPDAGINWKIIKFDPTEKAKLDALAEKGLRDILINAKELMKKRIEKAEIEHKKTLESITSVRKQKNKTMKPEEVDRLEQFAEAEKVSASKKAVAAAERSLREARGLALAFNLSDNIGAAILSMEELVRHRWSLLGVQDAVVEEEEVEA